MQWLLQSGLLVVGGGFVDTVADVLVVGTVLVGLWVLSVLGVVSSVVAVVVEMRVLEVVLVDCGGSV